MAVGEGKQSRRTRGCCTAHTGVLARPASTHLTQPGASQSGASRAQRPNPIPTPSRDGIESHRVTPADPRGRGRSVSSQGLSAHRAALATRPLRPHVTDLYASSHAPVTGARVLGGECYQRRSGYHFNLRKIRHTVQRSTLYTTTARWETRLRAALTHRLKAPRDRQYIHQFPLPSPWSALLILTGVQASRRLRAVHRHCRAHNIPCAPPAARKCSRELAASWCLGDGGWTLPMDGRVERPCGV
ncbi:hypothetical protein CALCODRAFT_115008 [Calocera cornea HHB12733]|uniref:Uncharacterized protein n=1 Tax=Calocera cornea HHB12733 TaxID=1353952 RepID=A0A165IBN2_9BASI|nr:hypothetical protein CALCODRAFT_115008 [Calocera cornea HHB12733]